MALEYFTICNSYLQNIYIISILTVDLEYWIYLHSAKY